MNAPGPDVGAIAETLEELGPELASGVSALCALWRSAYARGRQDEREEARRAAELRSLARGRKPRRSKP